MKKLLAISAVVLLVASMSSCKKDRDCTCTDSSGAKDVVVIEDAKKSDAKDACEALSAIAAIGGGKCELD
ncbi:MAG: hypothetical protein AB8B61_08505 [Cyclobacteriaceae bacterium]